MVTEDARTRVINSLKKRIMKGEKFDYIPKDETPPVYGSQIRDEKSDNQPEEYQDNTLQLVVADENDEEIQSKDIRTTIKDKNPFLYNRNHYKVEVQKIRHSVGYPEYYVTIEVKKSEE